MEDTYIEIGKAEVIVGYLIAKEHEERVQFT